MKKQSKTLASVFKYIRRYLVLIVISIILAIISVAAALYVPIVIGEAIDCIVGKGNVDINRVLSLLIRILWVIVIGALSQWGGAALNNRITSNVVHDIRKDAFKKIIHLPLSYIDKNPVGSVVSRVISDVDTFADGLLLGFTQLFTGIFTILGTMFFMFSINPLIAVIVVILTPLSILTANFIAKRTYSMFKLQSEARAEQTAFIDEIIGNQKTVKAFAHEDEAIKSFDEINERLEKYSLRAIFFSSLPNPSTRFINNLVYAAVALFGALSVIGKGMSVGMLSCLLSYVNQYTKPFNEISGVVTEFQNALACAERIFALIDEQPESDDSSSIHGIGNLHGNVKLENVYFSYSKDKELLKNVSVFVKSGQRIAIVGPTGCGKTTLINLLMRFYDVDSGKISVDNFDIRDISRADLRSNFGMVLQDTWLKSGSVRENIVMGKPDADDNEILEAAKAAHSYSFIRRLPNGFDTVIGEDGGALSQGQKQLLCITRLMLCLPPMLILDEATSSIDTRTEIKIQKAFSDMMNGRTSFIVAHRLSTIQSSDLILVMKDGNIVEQGTHEHLLAKKGLYYDLYHSQFAH